MPPLLSLQPRLHAANKQVNTHLEADHLKQTRSSCNTETKHQIIQDHLTNIPLHLEQSEILLREGGKKRGMTFIEKAKIYCEAMQNPDSFDLQSLIPS